MPATNNQLTEREQEILRLVATGVSNKEIAKELYISTNTVKVHMRNIFTKIGVNSRTEAAMYAVNTGIVPSAQPLKGERGSISDIEPSSEEGTKRSNIALILFLILAGLALVLVFLWRSTQPASEGAYVDVPTSQWETLASMPTARSGLAVAVYENKIYAIAGDTGGVVTNVVERYDPEMDEWTSLASKPTAVSDVGAAMIGGKIYVPGGQLASGKTTDILEIYDPRIDSWSQGAPLPEATSAYGIATFEGKLYIFGGWNRTEFTKTVFVYDPVLEVWTEKTAMSTARAYSGAAFSRGKIYVIGGFDGSNPLNIIEEYSPDIDNGSNDPWRLMPGLPYVRYAMGVTSVADIIFIVGGIGLEDEVVTSIVYKPQELDWHDMESPYDEDWVYGRLITLGTRLFALGGKVGAIPVDKQKVYQAIYTIAIPLIR